MRNKLLTALGIICLLGFAAQGVFGLAAALLISAIVGIVYGLLKKDKKFLRYSFLALIIDLTGIMGFYIALINSNM